MSEAVELWWLDLDALADRAPVWQALLQLEELEHSGSFALPQFQQRFRAARAGLRIILANYLGRNPRELTLLRSPTGKPQLEPSGTLEFNLSHSGPVALVAVTAGRSCRIPVGVDVEQVRADLDWQGISRQIFHPQEQAAVARDGWRTFFTLWTRKEAWLKATGTGWTDQANLVNLLVDNSLGDPYLGQRLVVEHRLWWLRSLPQPAGQPGEWAAAVCQGEVNLPICWRTAEELGCLWDRWC